jgi:N6-L-threonylcarbamoyladenine synthase
MIILGIETSCDETAASIVTGEGEILSNVIFSQIEEHAPYGGVVPEIAARAHLEAIDWVIEKALKDARIEFEQLNGVAATCGPGLIGGVLVGSMTGKAIAAALQTPFIAVNHLEGHALTARLTDQINFPYLLLLASGGHTQLIAIHDIGSYEIVGGTIDDALGEAFDKTAKMLGLGFPGGPMVEKTASQGILGKYKLPYPLKGRKGANFSFSGLKTAVRQKIEGMPAGKIPFQEKANLCADFQRVVAEIVEDRTINAIEVFKKRYPKGGALVAAGGVAANQAIRSALKKASSTANLPFIVPPPSLCTDNGAMIAWVGIERLTLGCTNELDFKPRPRWPLNEISRYH